MLALILALLGIIVGFFILEVGFILEIVAIFVARNQMKKNEKYAKSAYYISLIAAVLQLIVWVVVMAYTIITVTDILDKGKKEWEETKNRLDVKHEYEEICHDEINIENYSSFEEYDKEHNKCINDVDACFETYDDLDKAKKCADDIFK